ncbi:polysaccharide biosynthesis/export family protein [Alcaligenaceae bacterium]|nr:polysaccharide biosynthesis/export family protein [Alcaligenaceae bacterium]
MRGSVLVLLAVALAGCGGSFFSASGPTKGAILKHSDDETPPYTLVELSADTIAPYMRPREPVLTPAVSDTPMPEVKLVSGDVLRVMVSDSSIEGALFAPLSTGGTVFNKVRIDSKGNVSLPYLGRQKVSGLTLGQVEDKLRGTAAQYASDPQVHVELVSDLSGSVLVAGAVKSPGRFSALEGPLTLLDAINEAGGVLLEPHLVRVILRTGKKVETYSYQDILSGGNHPVPPRSEIIVERARQRIVAMGAVSKPGLVDLPSDNPSLLEVLGTVGGLNERTADARGVFVFRLEDNKLSSEPLAKVFRLDLRDPAAIFLARNFLVLPEDAVYVTNAHSYEFQKLISPIVQVLILGRSVDAIGN